MEFDENCTDCSPTPCEDVDQKFFPLASHPLDLAGGGLRDFPHLRSNVSFFRAVILECVRDRGQSLTHKFHLKVCTLI
jgi:hypothetical protein